MAPQITYRPLRSGISLDDSSSRAGQGLRVVTDSSLYYDNHMTVVGEELTCKRCRHVWSARIPRRPVQCPRCKSPAWDRALASMPQISEALVQYKTGAKQGSPSRHGGKRDVDFTKLPSFGMWRDLTESDEELLNRLGGGWGEPEGLDDPDAR